MGMFCPKCGSLMVPKKIDKKIKMVCPNCGYVDDNNDSVQISEKTENKKEIEVIDNPDVDSLKSKTKIKCPKCGNDEAYFWTVQTRAGDEPETKFYKCTKCGYTWRDYS